MKTNPVILTTALLFSLGTAMAQCPDTLTVWQTGCGQVEASINHFGSTGNLIWTWGDGESSSAVNPATHQYDALGTYEICAQAWSSGCPQGVELCVLFELEQCPEDCGLSISTVSQENGLLTLMASDFPQDAMVHWEQNGDIVNIGDQTTFELEFGNNEICAYYETPECPQGVFWCNNFFFQNPDCPTAIEAQQVGCDVFNLSLVGGFSGASVLWSVGSDVIEGDTELNGVQLSPGNNQITALYNHPDYPLCDDTQLSLNVSALLCDSICELELVHTWVSLNPMVFSALNYDPGALVTWTVNGNPAGTGHNFTLSSQVPGGTYTVCASYDSEYCDEVIEECATISLPNCPTGITAEQLSCGVYELTLENAQEGSTIQWSYPGNSFESNATPQIVILEEWFNVITAVYNNPDNPECDGSIYSQLVIHTSCDTVCSLDVDMIQGVEGDMFIASAGQEDAVIEWSIGGEPVAFGDTLNLDSLSPGQYLICAAYETPFCPEGVLWCDTYVVSDDDCPFELIVEEGDECGCYDFTIGPSGAGGAYMWNMGDTSFVSLTPGVSYCFVPGFQTVYVQIMGSNFPDCETSPLVHQWQVPDCDEPTCPAELFVLELEDCGCYMFTVNPPNIGGSYMWNLGDTSFVSSLASHIQCYEPGFQTVYVQILESDIADCEMAPLVHQWEQIDCDGCSLGLTFEHLGGGLFEFQASVYGSNAPLWWDFGDGFTTETGNWSTQHIYLPGNYTVCVITTDTVCPEILEACVEFTVEDSVECFWWGGIWGTTAASPPVTFDFLFSNEAGDEVGFFTSWLEGDSIWFGGEWCLLPGCYHLMVSSDVPLTPEMIEPDLWMILPDVIPMNINWQDNDNPFEWEAWLEILVECEDPSVGVQENPLDVIRVFPVPTRDLLQIELSGVDGVDCILFNAVGQPVLTRVLRTNDRISLAHLPAGLYIMQFRHNDQVKTFSIPVLN
ncbi:MAG: T9SS C-terminal target domain-containing protein [Cryomorphaceae bacterium]|nr:MAG: T9SS C-terminal target domain-containing protein [Cryomorphaceae bacterium]